MTLALDPYLPESERVYTNWRDAVWHEVEEPLGAYVDRFNVIGLADEVLTTQYGPDGFCYVPRADLDHDAWWAVAARYALGREF